MPDRAMMKEGFKASLHHSPKPASKQQGLQKGSYTVVVTDLTRERLTLQNERGRQFESRPGQLRPQGEQDPAKLYERRAIEIHDGDRIRWTATDHRRGLLNADQAQIIAVDAKGVPAPRSS